MEETLKPMGGHPLQHIAAVPNFQEITVVPKAHVVGRKLLNFLFFFLALLVNFIFCLLFWDRLVGSQGPSAPSAHG